MSARPQRWRAAWWLFLAAGSAAALATPLVTSPSARSGLHLAVALATPLVLVAGIRLHRPGRRTPWLLVAAGQLCRALGDLLHGGPGLPAGPAPLPWLADAAHLAAVPLLAAGLVSFTRGRRTSATGRLEVAITVVSLALPLWMHLVHPALGGAAGPAAARLRELGDPLGDLLLIALLVRLTSTAGLRSPAVRLLAVGTALLPVADLLPAPAGGAGAPGGLGAALGLAASLCWGAAGLHPAMRPLADGEESAAPASPGRPGLFVVTGVIPALMLFPEVVRPHPAHLWAVAAANVAVTALGITRMQFAMRDAVEAARARERVRAEAAHQAVHDALTGLPNRAGVLQLLHARLDLAERRRRPLGLLVVDVDHLARINDEHGELAGDEALASVARELAAAVGDGDVVGRLGGDEFAVVVEDVAGEDALPAVAERLTRLPLHVPSHGHLLEITCSVGVAVRSGGRAVDAEVLLHEAVTAAARAKGCGGARSWVFDDDLRAELEEQAEVEAAVRAGLGAGEFLLHYQPVVDVATRRLRGLEALVRWDRPGHGLVRPDLFVPVTERSDLVCELGRWVLGEATRQLAAWRAEGTVDADVHVAVNLSGRHLARRGVLDDVAQALAAADLPAHALVLEATETVLMEHEDVLDTMRRLRASGVGLSLDDFGTGYTSLEQLRTLPLDTLKVDRGFLVSGTAADRALVGLLVHCAHVFGLQVVAEGVEREEHLALLREVGCDLAQGYLLSRPVPADAVARAVREATADLGALGEA
ncbi:putative bifunctional diguanylate cyclase/phosphodiesterase [Kineococcus sp. SYSU DK006]|uniref:putative bifunctional diguanylate cyclase/phosphodiesterase n=1 Tax=Kineococcus sp. SYSU DK006 TaxID=3383127 RepID=UPI003D7C5F61